MSTKKVPQKLPHMLDLRESSEKMYHPNLMQGLDFRKMFFTLKNLTKEWLKNAET